MSNHITSQEQPTKHTPEMITQETELTEKMRAAHETLWAMLSDCVAAKVDSEQLCFPAEFDEYGNQIHLEINAGEHYLLIDRHKPVECYEGTLGVFTVTADDQRGSPQRYEIQPLIGYGDFERVCLERDVAMAALNN